MNPKQRAALAAVEYLKSDTTIGLGTGSTADFFLSALAAAMAKGVLKNIRAVASSKHSELRAAELGIPLIHLTTPNSIDLTVDGADEVDPNLNLIKGLGGALLREKILAQNTRQFIIIVDTSKRVTQLGTHSALPVEIVPFAHESTGEFLRSFGCLPTLRRQADHSPFVTDNGNYIYDCKFSGIKDPAALDLALCGRSGVVESGLFLKMANIAIVADENTVTTLTRP
jgi:ribose 5-phosphate isomerase A